MPSLRLFAFLMVSMMGHAAILVPLSDYLPALADVEKIESNTVIVSISVVSHAGASVMGQVDVTESSHPLHNATRSSHVHRQQKAQQTTHVEPFKVAPSFAVSPQQPILAAAKPAPVEEPVTKTVKAKLPTKTAKEQFSNTLGLDARLEQSAELEARRHLQLLAEERYLAELLNAIAKHRFYPSSARKKGHQGSVEIELTILKNGEFESVKIGKPSNYHSLNKATTRALNRLRRFKPFPSDIQRDSWHISIPFRYVLHAKRDNHS